MRNDASASWALTRVILDVWTDTAVKGDCSGSGTSMARELKLEERGGLDHQRRRREEERKKRNAAIKIRC